MNENEDAIKSLIQGIKYMIKKSVENSISDKTVNATVKSLQIENTYDILIDGIPYYGIPSLINGLKVNEIVKVTIPQNQYSQMFILGKIV